MYGAQSEAATAANKYVLWVDMLSHFRARVNYEVAMGGGVIVDQREFQNYTRQCDLSLVVARLVA